MRRFILMPLYPNRTAAPFHGDCVTILVMKPIYDVIILGAGAGGLMCAGRLAGSGLKVALIEGNAKPGRKLKISGGGKCNITNADVRPRHYLGEPEFVEAVLDAFSKEALLAFLAERGLNPVLRKGRYYFCPRSADEIIGLLERECSGTEIRYRHQILGLKKGERFEVLTDRGSFEAAAVVVATGGASYPDIGASDIGLRIAGEFGHHIIPFAPALAGLTLQKEQFWMKALSGISFPVRIEADGRTIDEEMLFAHRGISGPAVLSASLYWQRGTIAIDFAPGRDVVGACRNEKRLVSTLTGLPKRFARAFLEHVGVEDRPGRQLDANALERLARLHRYEFAPAGTFGFTKAEASKGGVDTEALNPYTMESLRVPGLYFIGEVVDVTGELGGYNFQWAFSSAVVAARALLERSRS